MVDQAYQQRVPFHLQIDNDILLRRSNSLRQGLPNIGTSGRRKSSLEEIGISHFTTLMQATNHSNPIKIALNGSIGLEVTPPEEPTASFLGVPGASGGGGGSSNVSPQRTGSMVGLNVQHDMNSPAIQIQQESPSPTSPQPPTHHQNLQGTIV